MKNVDLVGWRMGSVEDISDNRYGMRRSSTRNTVMPITAEGRRDSESFTHCLIALF